MSPDFIAGIEHANGFAAIIASTSITRWCSLPA